MPSLDQSTYELSREESRITPGKRNVISQQLNLQSEKRLEDFGQGPSVPITNLVDDRMSSDKENYLPNDIFNDNGDIFIVILLEKNIMYICSKEKINEIPFSNQSILFISISIYD